jgi:hypothetical protein
MRKDCPIAAKVSGEFSFLSKQTYIGVPVGERKVTSRDATHQRTVEMP